MDKFLMVSKILREFGNCAAGLNAYETPARPFKDNKKYKDNKKNWDMKIKKINK